MSFKIFADYVFRFWRIPNSAIARINLLCEPLVIATPALVGTAITFMIGSIMVLCLTRTLSGAMAVTTRRPVWILSAIFSMWFFVHLTFGLTHSTSEETLSEIAETLGFLGVPILYAGLALTSPHKLAWPTELAASLGAIAAAIVALFQLHAGWPRAEGFIGNPGPFALMTLLLYGYCLVALVRHSGLKQVMVGVGAAAAFGCVIMSGMRGLWPGLLILPIVVAIIYASELRRRVDRFQVGLMLAALALLIFVTYPIVGERFGILFGELATLDRNLDLTRSLDQHVAMWTAGLTLISEAPLTGHGLDIVPLMQSETLQQVGEAFALSHFHNAFIDIGVRAGAIGILLLVLMITAPLVLTAGSRGTEMGRYGFAMMSVLMTAYLLSGSTGLMLGHDVQGIIFVFSVTYWSVFAFEGGTGDE